MGEAIVQSLQRYTQARQKFAFCFCFRLGYKVTVGVRVGTRQVGVHLSIKVSEGKVVVV